MTGRVRIVLQARTTSSRLPAKVLLPVGGLPLAILCARRLGNQGHEVILATSDEDSDDLLAATAAAAGIRVFRGSLDNVLSRFLACAEELDEDDILVRATADNPLPDGLFIDRLVETLRASGQSYMGTSSPSDGLPYGVSAEAFHVRALRSVGASREPSDLEHVTYSLRRQAGTAGVVPPGLFLQADASGRRATVDTLQDYLAMAEVFRRCASALDTPWDRLVEALPATSDAFAVTSPLMLGTAQLGSAYGIANRIGRPSDEQVRELFATAIPGAVTWVDTARAYGDAESRLGALGLPAGMKIVTKLAPLTDLADTASPEQVRRAVEASVQASSAALGRNRLDVLMFHRSADMFRWQGLALERLQAFVESRRIAALGVSVYTPEEAIRCLADARITHVQIPFNLLDQRWLDEPFQDALARRPDVLVHVRSVFLQGLLVNDAEVWPSWVQDRERLVADIREQSQRLRRANAADLGMAYVRGYPWVSSLVMGVESAAQLDELLQLARHPALAPEELMSVRQHLAGAPPRLLNPAEWHQ